MHPAGRPLIPALENGAMTLATLAMLTMPGPALCATARHDRVTPSPRVAAAVTGGYVWHSDPLLHASPERDLLLDELQKMGIREIYVSFRVGQIDSMGHRSSDGNLTAAFSALVGAAHSRGIRVDLLLGDPSWILPSQREGLVSTVRKFDSVPYDNLQLDLEPNQLSASYSEEWLTKQLGETIEYISQAASHPTGISIHPRYFEQAVYRTCLICSLRNSRVSEVTLMAYTTSAQRAIAMTRNIIHDNPDIDFKVALSFERELPADNSFAHIKPAEINARITDLRATLSSERNFLGIVVQTLDDFRHTPLR